MSHAKVPLMLTDGGSVPELAVGRHSCPVPSHVSLAGKNYHIELSLFLILQCTPSQPHFLSSSRPLYKLQVHLTSRVHILILDQFICH